MHSGRWVIGMMLCAVFCTSSWYAVRTFFEVRLQQEDVEMLAAELSRLHGQRRQSERRIEHAHQAALLLSRARSLGIDPSCWMRSSFALDTGRELDALLLADPVYKRLRLEKERISKEQDNSQSRIRQVARDDGGDENTPPEQRAFMERVTDRRTDTLLQRVEERRQLRKQWLEARTLYTGEAVVALLNDLSNSSGKALFAPEAFELNRVSANRYEVRARGTFLARRTVRQAEEEPLHE